MAYGALTVGRLVLAEPFTLDDKPGTVSLSGQESTPPLTRAALYAAHRDLTALAGLDAVVPVTFPDKPERDGYYSIRSSASNLTDWGGTDGAAYADWSLELDRYGSAGFVDLESQLVPTVRANDFALTGTVWHGVPVGAYAYDTGATQPLKVDRTTADGVVPVYYSVPAVAPRWHSTPAAARLGRARILDNSREVTGERAVAPTTWELSNGLVRVRPLAGGGSQPAMEIATWEAGTWKPKQWAMYAGSDQFGPAAAASILRNDFEACSIRLIDARADGTRMTVDLTLRRGSRFVDIYGFTPIAAFWALDLWTTEAFTAGTGYRVATAADGDGLKAIVGSNRTFGVAGHGGIVAGASRQSAAMWAGTVQGTAFTGDQPADLAAQFIGSPGETVRAVRR